ncbi:hypothetical protein THOM_0545, partial [Trachipleistophora hominis]
VVNSALRSRSSTFYIVKKWRDSGTKCNVITGMNKAIGNCNTSFVRIERKKNVYNNKY